MKPNQLHFATVRDWREPQVITLHRLASIITAAARDGFTAVRMELTRHPAGYKLTFQRNHSTCETRPNAI